MLDTAAKTSSQRVRPVGCAKMTLSFTTQIGRSRQHSIQEIFHFNIIVCPPSLRTNLLRRFGHSWTKRDTG